jgi:hypothetical protein
VWVGVVTGEEKVVQRKREGKRKEKREGVKK